VHFRNFPTEKILKCNSREAAEKAYMHSLKQALFVLQGNTRSFNAMVLEQQQSLWESANSGSRGLFESVAAELRGSETTKCIPIRIFHRKRRKMISCESSGDRNQDLRLNDSKFECEDNQADKCDSNRQNSTYDVACIQKPVHLQQDKEGTETLLRDVLEQFVPGIFPALKADALSLPPSTTVLVQGIQLPLDSHVFHLWKSCAHADLFLYIVVIVDAA
jgi:Autophagy protein Apg5